MTYTDHLRDLICALLRARPDVSGANLSEQSGLGKNWVSGFLSRRAGTLGRADDVVATCRRLCPVGSEGDEVRRLLRVFDQPRKDAA